MESTAKVLSKSGLMGGLVESSIPLWVAYAFMAHQVKEWEKLAADPWKVKVDTDLIGFISHCPSCSLSHLLAKECGLDSCSQCLYSYAQKEITGVGGCHGGSAYLQWRSHPEGSQGRKEGASKVVIYSAAARDAIYSRMSMIDKMKYLKFRLSKRSVRGLWKTIRMYLR